MSKLLLAFLLTVVTMPLFAREETVRCESKNGKYTECRYEGMERASLTRQLSDQRCNRGDSWGRRGNVIWVDRGCRGEFSIQISEHDDEDDDGQVVLCESKDDKYVACRADTQGGVRLARRLSDRSCVQGESWGYRRGEIWVDHGCRGEFRLGERDNEQTNIRPLEPARPTTQTVRCESEPGRRRTCRINTNLGVQIKKQLSKKDCVYNSTWGYDSEGIWVFDGCRAEFLVRQAP